MRTTTIIESIIMTLGQSTVKHFKGIIFQVIAALGSRLFYLSAPLVPMKLGRRFALKAKLFPFFVYFSLTSKKMLLRVMLTWILHC